MIAILLTLFLPTFTLEIEIRRKGKTKIYTLIIQGVLCALFSSNKNIFSLEWQTKSNDKQGMDQ